MTKKKQPLVPEGYEERFVSFVTLKNGRRLYASRYGKKAFRIIVRVKM